MKYRKPKHWDRAAVIGPIGLIEFLDSLPDEFEIVPEGYSVVKWPRELTRDHLKGVSLGISWPPARSALDALAAIAPEKKRRKADIWKHTSGQKIWLYPEDNWHPTNIGWRKVGECEIEE